MKLDPDGIRARDTKAMYDLVQVCKKAARIGTKRAAAMSFAEDVGQDLVMLVMTKWIDHYNPDRDVEPFLVESARRMALSYMRASNREIHMAHEKFSEYGENSWPGGSVHEGSISGTSELEGADVLSNALEDELDVQSKQARIILIQRLRERDRMNVDRNKLSEAPPTESVPNIGSTTESVVADRRRESRRAKIERSSVQEIIRTRKELRLNQSDMAQRLGISLERLRRIESGMVEGNAEVLAIKARTIKQEQAMIGDSTSKNDGEKFYLGLCDMLKVQPENVVLVSKLLGVHRTTIFRWRTGRTIPLAAVTQHFNNLAEQMVKEKDK
jgi:DNA-binding XRE family transcriptional regulator